MIFPFYISRRYLFAKKSQNVINIISAISVIGVAVGTMALIVVLSVFNGFDNLIKSLYNSFYPDIKISATVGKTFTTQTPSFQKVKHIQGVSDFCNVVEENALLKYGDRQFIATIKGVDYNYAKVCGLDTMIRQGSFMLEKDSVPFAIIGQGVAYYLAVGLNFVNPIYLYVPRRNEELSFDPNEAFNKMFIFPSGIFSIEEDFDEKYVIVPISFARNLLEYKDEVTSVEIKLDSACNKQAVQSEIQHTLGKNYTVQNRYEQNKLFYRIMKSEKWAIYFILTFILIVASFNIIGSLTMLILEKKDDSFTLRSMGADIKLLRKIFLIEGWSISAIGALIGLGLGGLICWLQEKFELVKLHGSGSFIINAYPVDMHFIDFVAVLLTVAVIGFITTWYPVKFITKKYLSDIS